MTTINSAARLLEAAKVDPRIEARVLALIKEKESALHSLKAQKDNPTVSPSYWRTVGSLEALIAIRDALKGNLVNLNLL